MYKYESLCITLTWSNPPSVSYYTGSEVNSTIQDSFTNLRLAHLQCSKNFIGCVISRVCQCWYCPEKCIIGPIPITNPIIGTSLNVCVNSKHINVLYVRYLYTSHRMQRRRNQDRCALCGHAQKTAQGIWHLLTLPQLSWWPIYLMCIYVHYFTSVHLLLYICDHQSGTYLCVWHSRSYLYVYINKMSENNWHSVQ